MTKYTSAFKALLVPSSLAAGFIFLFALPAFGQATVTSEWSGPTNKGTYDISVETLSGPFMGWFVDAEFINSENKLGCDVDIDIFADGTHKSYITLWPDLAYFKANLMDKNYNEVRVHAELKDKNGRTIIISSIHFPFKGLRELAKINYSLSYDDIPDFDIYDFVELKTENVKNDTIKVFCSYYRGDENDPYRWSKTGNASLKIKNYSLTGE